MPLPRTLDSIVDSFQCGFHSYAAATVHTAAATTELDFMGEDGRTAVLVYQVFRDPPRSATTCSRQTRRSYSCLNPFYIFTDLGHKGLKWFASVKG